MQILDDGSKSAGYVRGYVAKQAELDELTARVRELERTIEQMCEQIQNLPGSRETVTAYMLAAAVHPKISAGLKP